MVQDIEDAEIIETVKEVKQAGVIQHPAVDSKVIDINNRIKANAQNQYVKSDHLKAGLAFLEKCHAEKLVFSTDFIPPIPNPERYTKQELDLLLKGQFGSNGQFLAIMVMNQNIYLNYMALQQKLQNTTQQYHALASLAGGLEARLKDSEAKHQHHHKVA